MDRRISFGVYELDRDAMELRKRGVPIRLQEQPLRVLLMLAERPGEIVTREELQEKIWGNTFVDFDQSLNKAINRVREALNDSAGTPQYVETIPRRGYRFIAPVIAPAATEAPDTAAYQNTPEIPAQPRSALSPYRIFIIAALAIAGLLAVIGIAAFVRWRQPKSPTVQEARLIASFGWQPALSRDGKLLAYASSVGDQPAHIWVQQTAGGEAIPVTTGPDLDAVPDFSPDGTRIAFYSERKGGGIYTTSTLPGEPRLLVGAPRAIYPRFSPTGDSVLYWQNKMVHGTRGWRPACVSANQSGPHRVFPANLGSRRKGDCSLWEPPPRAKQAGRLVDRPTRTRQCEVIAPPGSGAKWPVTNLRASVGPYCGQPRMDPLLDYDTAKLEALAHPNLSRGHNRWNSRNGRFRQRRWRRFRLSIKGWQACLHGLERQRIHLSDFDQQSRPKTWSHFPVTSPRGGVSQLSLGLPRRKVDGIRHRYPWQAL
jgi:DNA-binding winged helix-turn-helix (wHTH) protein